MSDLGSNRVEFGQATGDVVAGVIHGGVHFYAPETGPIRSDSSADERAAFVLYREGATAWSVGDLQTALRKFEELLVNYETSRQQTVKRWIAIAGVNKGVALQMMGRPQEACAAYSDLAIRAEGAVDSDVRQAVALGIHNWIKLLYFLGDYGRVMERAARLQEWFGRDDDPRREPLLSGALVMRAAALLKGGSHAQAIAAATDLRSRFAPSGDRDVQYARAVALHIVAKAQEAMGQRKAADATFAEMIATYGNSPDPGFRAIAESARIQRRSGWSRLCRR